MTSLFKSEQGKKRIFELYDQKLEELQIKFTTHDVVTKFGNTRIIETGDTSKPILFLVHGSNGHAPIALETYSNLIDHFHVFAVDVLAQPNKSDGHRLNMKDLSYGEWMSELIKYFGFKSVYIAGFSFGGLVILKTLEFDQTLVKHAFLTAPAYIVNGNPFKAMYYMFFPMKHFMKSGRTDKLNSFLKALFTKPDDYAFHFLSVVFKEFKMDFTPIPKITKVAAGQITIPLTIFAAKNDLVFPGEKMIKRVRKIFPNNVNTVLLENSKHVQDKEDNRCIQNTILSAIR